MENLERGWTDQDMTQKENKNPCGFYLTSGEHLGHSNYLYNIYKRFILERKIIKSQNYFDFSEIIMK